MIFTFVIKNFYGGGAEKVVLNTALMLHDSGHTVRIIMLQNLSDHVVPLRLNVEKLSVVNKFTKIISSRTTEIVQAAFVKRKLKESPSDVVISCGCEKITRHIKGFDIFFWVHSNLTGNVDSVKRLKKVVSRSYDIYCGRSVIAVSQGAKLDLVNNVGLDAKRINVITNPINRDEIVKKAAVRDGDSLIDHDYFVAVGRIERRKRYDLMLEAFSESGVTERLVIVGAGTRTEFAMLREQIENKGLAESVILYGFTTNPYPLIAGAKGLLLSSEREGLPTVLIEAMMLGTPCISFDCPSGPSELLVAEQAKYLIPFGNCKQFAAAIQQLSRTGLSPTPALYERFLPENAIREFEALASAHSRH